MVKNKGKKASNEAVDNKESISDEEDDDDDDDSDDDDSDIDDRSISQGRKAAEPQKKEKAGFEVVPQSTRGNL